MAGNQRQRNYSNPSRWLLLTQSSPILCWNTIQGIFVPETRSRENSRGSKTCFFTGIRRSQEIFPHNFLHYQYSWHSDWCSLQHLQLHSLDSQEKSAGLCRVTHLLITDKGGMCILFCTGTEVTTKVWGATTTWLWQRSKIKGVSTETSWRNRSKKILDHLLQGMWGLLHHLHQITTTIDLSAQLLLTLKLKRTHHHLFHCSLWMTSILHMYFDKKRNSC